jgi:hypothetical protein
MRKFIFGIIAGLLVLALGGLTAATLGLLPTTADATPPPLERRVATGALDASMERHAARASSPIPPTDEILIDGMKVYTMNGISIMLSALESATPACRPGIKL